MMRNQREPLTSKIDPSQQVLGNRDVFSTQPHLAERMQSLVDEIFRALEERSVPYCILRNRDRIPEGLLEWSDIDLIVGNQSTATTLTDAFNHLHPVQVVRTRPAESSYFFPLEDRYLRVDVWYKDLSWRGATYIRTEDILRQRRLDDGYFVASPVHQAFVAWCSKLLWGGVLPVRYEPLINEAVRDDPDALGALLVNAFGPKVGRELLLKAWSGAPADSTSRVRACRRSLWMRQFRRHPFYLIQDLVQEISLGLLQRARPTGVDVALLGPDGAGKTTVAMRIASLPSRKVAFGHVHYVRLSRRVLPPCSRIKGFLLRRPIRPAIDPQHPHKTPTHQPLVWFLKYLYYALDLWLEQFWLRKELAHTNLVVRDRHLIELPIDPRRYRYAGPLPLARLIARLVPKPTLLIILDAPADILQARKQDVTIDESTRQRAAYLALAQDAANGYVVDSTQSLDDVQDEVLGIINEFVSRRTRSRTRELRMPGGTP